MSETTNIYGEIRSLDEFQNLFDQLWDEALKVSDRQQLTEIKERSEYLCTLADNPVWRDKFERGGARALPIGQEEDRRVTEILNERLRDLDDGGEPFRRWREGDDSNANRNASSERSASG